MTYISEIIIQGFQIHEDTHMHLSPNLNVLVGETDQGKSSVFRVIRWVARNAPNTDSYLNHKLKKALGALVLSNGYKIERYRDSKSNLYRIYKDNELLHELKATRGSVPNKVTEILNMTDLNFEKQFSMPFMISESGGEVARMWNKVSSMDLADGMKKSLKSQLGTTKQELESTSISIQNEIDTQEKLKPVKGARKLFDQASDIESKIETNADAYQKVKDLIEKIKNLTDDFNYLSIVLDTMGPKIDEIEAIQTDIEKAMEEKNFLKKTISKIESIENNIEYFTKVNNLKHISRLNDLVKEYDTQTQKLEQIHEVINRIEGINTDIEYQNEQLKSNEHQLKKLQKEIGKCPFCGGVL